MRAGLVLLACLVASAAQAQDTTTTCGAELGRWVCHTSPARKYFDAAAVNEAAESGRRAYEATTQMMDSYAAARDAAQARARSSASSNTALYDHLMLTGQCDAARQLALRELGRNEVDAVAEHCH